jgi:hypothetical protein
VGKEEDILLPYINGKREVVAKYKMVISSSIAKCRGYVPSDEVRQALDKLQEISKDIPEGFLRDWDDMARGMDMQAHWMEGPFPYIDKQLRSIIDAHHYKTVEYPKYIIILAKEKQARLDALFYI